MMVGEDEALIEAMARAIADTVYSNHSAEQREPGDHEAWLSEAAAALNAYRQHSA
jgi:hypothetical protein